MNKGLLLVLSAPSGAGKGTIIKRLMDDDRSLKLSVSATTRSPRPGEVDGEDYFFISREEFDDLVKNGEMLEHAEYVGNCYGTPKGPVERWLEDGLDVILEIDVQGGAQVKKIMPECVSIFILPPSMRELENRLRGRSTEKDEVVNARLEAARQEVHRAEDYDSVVVNDTVDQAVEEIKTIIAAEKHRFIRVSSIVERVLIDA